MEKNTAAFLALAAFFCGITVGFLIAPAKNGITIGSHNQIGRNDDSEEYDFDDEDEDEDENYSF